MTRTDEMLEAIALLSGGEPEIKCVDRGVWSGVIVMAQDPDHKICGWASFSSEDVARQMLLAAIVREATGLWPQDEALATPDKLLAMIPDVKAHMAAKALGMKR